MVPLFLCKFALQTILIMAKSILNKKSLTFLENYINNPSPTGLKAKVKKFG